MVIGDLLKGTCPTTTYGQTQLQSSRNEHLLTRMLRVVMIIFLLLYDSHGDLDKLQRFILTVHGIDKSSCICNEQKCPKLSDFYMDFVSDSRLNHNFYTDLIKIKYDLTEDFQTISMHNNSFTNVIGIYLCDKTKNGYKDIFNRSNHQRNVKIVQANCDMSELNVEDTQGQWAPIYCPSMEEGAINANYIIQRNKNRYIFEFDLRNLNLDLCALEPRTCQQLEECKFEKKADWNLSLNNFKCICSTNCSSVRSFIQKVPFFVQIFCIIACLFLGVLIFKFRSSKVIKLSNWFLLEIFLFGAVILYMATLAYYIYGEEWTCFLGPWLRGIGFSVMYGVLLVKIYRVLSSFQSRKAHRVYVRDKDMLKYLGVFIGIHVALMAGWTCINLDYISMSPWSEYKNLDLGMLTETQGQDYLGNLTHIDPTPRYVVCRILSWNIVAEIIEFVTLICAIRYCCLVKSAPNEFKEMNCITIALFIEAFVSGVFHILRHFIWTSIHPKHSFFLDFLRLQFTVTVNVILIIVPKLWYIRFRNSGVSNLSNNFRNNPGEEGNKQELLSYSNDNDFTDINLSDMDPEVIRRELKRLYAQMEIYKLKAMRKDNPHISKRRGGRKQRRFSLQPFHKKHHTGSGGTVNMSQIQSESPSVVQSGSGPQTNSPETLHIALDSHARASGHQQSSSSASGKISDHSKSDKKYSNSILIHEEEISRISEDSVNSVEETTLNLLKLNSND